ncbi:MULTISPECIES: tRNA (N(6)-L-threonylcarbamoyladenosine(37)-C(2))-methylthiotransferase MtaB [Peptoniphilus]|uniref:Threonylcarbamoyladenosine tRNA methylthiotransferase MtaB n=1 Tax=Peptoniphilus lacrimalis TaxID=33031 RepID=A0A379C2Z5_9FIRM|nr:MULTISPECIES: tRNA (N(6)-L-threonylcarbamoyladenosine(37)-C(2))-methylthiotransferase MtaB [Peptoniphilus]KGF37027.1 30S ribosomal protein S12 methylthiotransferase [Peptoniphilus lacrimalis DNF00528]EFK39459.1 tRNA methylthiotransferase YqeV [Peptoniphilus sp. oral taxon 836 str. F0141]MDK7722205.1 tRNA (N(6)-L-threonylcarbamoyladenosine(37)-C(2))-methylthiotransferase MtaB [Peptoniphilus lacrimalis]MDK7731807.1 tRNA (N(6)-L-threonylcarbamoyladenosine(37)-C(2))-methylthiotransferase MtaB [P
MAKTFSILTLGCKVNQYESEAMAELFEKNGYIQVDNDTDVADVYIVNTCTVTNLSDRKSRQYIRRAKRENPDSTVAVVGCYAQVAPKEVEKIEGVDVVIGTSERSKIVDLIEEAKEEDKKINIVRDIKKDRDFQFIKIDENFHKTRSYMKVQDGCNRYCTYCIIPYARGTIRSRRIGDCVREAIRLANAGYKEIILTGIHVGSYGVDLGPVRLIDLIEAIAEVDGIERIRLSSVEPNIISEDFMRRAIACSKLCDHFHLSLQSGSNKVLKDMNRHYNREEFIEKTKIIKKYMPYAGLTTDIIVGFPGESDEDFEDSMSIVREVEFSKVHVFKYSKRKNTPAADRADQVDGNIKIKRSEELIKLQDQYLKKFREKNMPRTLKVLFEEFDQGYYFGYTDNYIRVKVKSDKDLINKILDVRLVDNEEVALGELV